ncbi:hypothetical protein [Methylobacterium nigriterrae]|uniref:hypothetical protein n=1 Tax=Methylobacterium nigriterrae TaxID=3127512 RepID=UPI0030132FFC
MRMSLALAAFLTVAGGGFAAAQTTGQTTGTATTTAPDAKADAKADTNIDAAPHGAAGQKLEPGANSFTEGQVKARFEKMGFGEIKNLTKDDQGIWRGKAVHAGKEVSVGMDYKGNVAAQ